MSIVLLLILTIGTQALVETRNAEQNKIRLIARENARLGLMIALGELQRHAGPDQGVTARAEILNTIDASSDLGGRRFWTGVWDSADAAAPPVWLVSGLAPDPNTPATPADSQIIGSATAGEQSEHYVSAPTVEFDGGEIAWWVGDEGVKASVALTKALDSPDSDWFRTLSENEKKRSAYNIPERMGIEAFTSQTTAEGNYSFIPETPENRLGLGKIESVKSLNLFEGLVEDAETLFSHDLTVKAYGLLTRTDGLRGLRTDLSRQPDALGPEVAAFLNFRDYLVAVPPGQPPFITESEDLRRLHRIVPPATLSPSTGDPLHSVTPILTDFGIQFGVRVTQALYPRVILAMKTGVEMWNPYSSALVPEALIIEVSGLEPIQVTPINNKTDTAAAPITLNPHDYYGDPIRFRLDFTNLDTSAKMEPGSYDANVWGPGRVVYWVGQSANLSAGARPPSQGIQLGFGNNNASKSYYIDTGLRFPVVAIPQSSDLNISFTIPETTLSVSLKRASDEAEIASYDDLAFFRVDNSAPYLGSQWSNNHIGYQFRLRERGGTVDFDPSLWLKFTDPRKHNATLDLSEFLDDYAATYVWRENVSPEELPTSYKNTLQLSQFSAPEYFLYRNPTLSSFEHAGYERDAPLFELPRQPPLSLGALQHIQVADAPPFFIGNSWGDSLNAAFDQYFFSGLDDELIDEFNGSTPNPRLEVVNPSPDRFPQIDAASIENQAGQSSIFFLVKGAFNLNSTSVNAWTAVLASNSAHNFSFAERARNQIEDGTANQTASDIVKTDANGDPYQVPPFFTRFPHSIQELFQRDLATSLNPGQRAPYQFFQRGFKILTERRGNQDDASDYTMTDSQLFENLADAIVTRITERGKPFLSIREFLAPTTPDGPSLLEAAISDVPALHRDQATMSLTTVAIEERLPGYLSQADLMNALAPILSVRSDTFLIRSRGRAPISIEGQNYVEAICEALVQRVVTPVGFDTTSDLSQLNTPDGPFGRHFKIVSFRWLANDSI